MDQQLGQLANIAQRQKDYSKTEETLGRIVNLRTKTYGEAYDGNLLPLLRIASYQKVRQMNDLVCETCNKGIEHAKLCLARQDTQENTEKKNSVVKLLIEFYELLCH